MTVASVATAWRNSLSQWSLGRARSLTGAGAARRTEGERALEASSADDEALSDELVDLATGGCALPPPTER